MKNPFSSDKNEEKLNKEQVEEVENKAEEEEKAVEEASEETDNKEEKVEKTEEVNPLQEKYDALNNQYMRLAADFDNYRKRQEQEKEALLKYGAENTLKKMIEDLDNFERGIKAIETVEDCEKVK